MTPPEVSVRNRRNRRWWILGAIVVVIVTVGGAVFWFGANDRLGEARPESVPGLPDQDLLASSMRAEPVPGWRVSAVDLGLPPGTVLKPIGNVGVRGSFLGIAGDGWWVVGIDVGNGRRAFGPVRLGSADGAKDFECFVNGPPMLLCLRQDGGPGGSSYAWVVDTVTGSVIFGGTTDLRLSAAGSGPRLRQVGDFVVGAVTGVGTYGIGSRGELTWFVPGSGSVARPTAWNRDVASGDLAVQSGLGTGGGDVVFSAADGSVLTPAMPAGERLRQAVVYPGGFGYGYRRDGDGIDRVAFFDSTGASLSRPDVQGTLRVGSADVPMVGTATTDVVVTLAGRVLLEMPRSTLAPYARLVGDILMVASDEPRRIWQEYDLRTGTPGPACENESLGFGYLGSDGEVAITTGRRTPAQAMDLSDCKVLWSLPGSTRSSTRDVWRVDTTLIQRINDELIALVAPA